MVIVEKSFPRGGVASTEARAEAAKANIIFGATQKKLKKPKTKSKSINEEHIDDIEAEQEEPLESVSAELLSYATVQDGMNIMCIVKSVDQLYLKVSLPGRMTARISALEISDAYTKATQQFLENVDANAASYKSLKDLYSVGQIVYGRVQEVLKHVHGRTLINMSLKPSEVHADLVHDNIKKGFTFSGAIEEVQEHGYIIETGVQGLRAFLPLDKTNSGHVPGELIFLKVEKITHEPEASTCVCKELHVDNMKVKNQMEPNIDYILPGSIVQFKVSKLLKDGLQGTIMNEAFTAYVNEHQLTTPLSLPEDYEEKQQLNARVLYVMPLTKLVYLTLNLRLKQETTATETESETVALLKKGDVVDVAKVHHIGTGGVVLVLNNKHKGIISFKSIKANYKGNYDQDELLAKYAKKTKHKVRVLYYDLMDSLYICTDDAHIVEEKFFSLEDLQPGEFVTAKVIQRNPKVDGYKLQIGKLHGIIERLYLAPNTKQLEEQSKIRCRIISVNLERKIVYLTNRPEYLAKNCKVLCALGDAKVKANFMGTIVKNCEEYVLVKFFNEIKGLLYKQQLSGFMAKDGNVFYEGQTMLFRIASKSKEQITLTLPEDTFGMGEICPIEVVNTLESGLEINVSYATEQSEDEELRGLIPIRLLSDFTDLLLAKQRIYPAQTKTEAVCLMKNIFSLRDVEYFRHNLTNEWKNIKPGDILRAYVKNVDGDVVELLVPIRNYNKLVRVHLKLLRVNAIDTAYVELAAEQVVYVKVLSKEQITKTITVSAKLTDVWDKDLKSTAEYIESYLNEVALIRRSLKSSNAAIAKYAIGDKINVEFTGVHPETNEWLYATEKTKILAVLKPIFFGKAQPPAVGHKQECIILWIDYSSELLLVSHKPFDLAHITKQKNLPQNLVAKSGINAKVLLNLDNVVICSLKKGENPLVYCPVRLHYNDFENSCSNRLRSGEFCKLTFIHETLPIAVPDDTFKLWKDIKRKASQESSAAVKAKKQKLENAQSKANSSEKTQEKVTQTGAKKSKSKAESPPADEPKKKLKKTKAVSAVTESVSDATAETTLFFEDKTPNKVAAEAVQKPKVTPRLAGVTDFWNTDLTQLNDVAASSDEDEDDTNTDASNQKKKRLTATEKFKQQREEEARLRAIEEKYADPKHLPETVDQFDRLVLSEPNNSRNWINYMVFHLQSSEIEKARAIARRALKTISFRDSAELLNVWVALINLELRYGSKDSYDETLKESLICNDPLKIYLRLIEILTDAKKTQELMEIISLVTKKFKTETEVWRAAANAYFSIGMTERAQQLLQRALTCLPEREHVNTIVAFANLNHKHGQNEMAQTLLDQVVTSYPKRVDVWTQYVDLLVKSELIEPARAVLERAVLQKIPLKKMRTVFKKYLEFEERFGDEDSVQKVKKLATEFVKNNSTL